MQITLFAYSWILIIKAKCMLKWLKSQKVERKAVLLS